MDDKKIPKKINSVIRDLDLPAKFDPGVLKQAKKLPKELSESMIQDEISRGRKDLRAKKIVTIDGADAKDLDDGVFAERRADGKISLGVYIADVSFYVKENSPIDRCARDRGTSIYLVDKVLPMLPIELSNGICSLNEGVDRFAMACEMTLDSTGKILRHRIFPAVIRVDRRLTYDLANQILDSDPLLKLLKEIRDLRLEIRRARGSIEFELPDIKVVLDRKNRPVELKKIGGSISESIIEECMLAANETVARHLAKKHVPSLYRIHGEPSRDKLLDLNHTLARFNLYIPLKSGEEIHPSEIRRVVEASKKRPEEKLIHMMTLRSMQQARYSAERDLHFGLATDFYTHFTSPIRRYPDLIVHRILREISEQKKLPIKRREHYQKILPKIADHSSETERRAAMAERISVDLKVTEFMSKFIGKKFQAIVSGVMNFGFFVELENLAEGLVHASEIPRKFWDYQPQIGDHVEVLLLRADIPQRHLDFRLTEIPKSKSV